MHPGADDLPTAAVALARPDRTATRDASLSGDGSRLAHQFVFYAQLRARAASGPGRGNSRPTAASNALAAGIPPSGPSPGALYGRGPNLIQENLTHSRQLLCLKQTKVAGRLAGG